MPKFLILLKQGGQGCDYTIDCGVTYVFFEADDHDDAIAKALARDDADLDDYSLAYYGEDRIEEAYLLPAGKIIDLIKARDERDLKEKEEEKKRREKEDREAAVLQRLKDDKEREEKDISEYKRLKEKFEGK